MSQPNKQDDSEQQKTTANSSKITNKKPLKDYLKYSGMGFQLIGALLLGAWVGDYIDTKMENQTPIATLTCLLVMLSATLYLIIRQISKDN
jgi:hypothetical protein